MSLKILFSLCILVISGRVYSFNWGECYKSTISKTSIRGDGWFISSTQFSSSFNECSMIGDVVHDRKVFIALNHDKLQVDAARGGGEYIIALASLYSCRTSDVGILSKVLQENYVEVFGENDSSETFLKKIDHLVESSRGLMVSCRV